jgi:hypothetical protein
MQAYRQSIVGIVFRVVIEATVFSGTRRQSDLSCSCLENDIIADSRRIVGRRIWVMAGIKPRDGRYRCCNLQDERYHNPGNKDAWRCPFVAAPKAEAE